MMSMRCDIEINSQKSNLSKLLIACMTPRISAGRKTSDLTYEIC